MKKISINNILILISLIFTSILMCSWYDEYNKNQFYNSDYNYGYSNNIFISSKIDMTLEKTKNVVSIANSNSILLEKIIIKNDNNIKGNYHYLSMNNLKSLTDKFNIPHYVSSKKGITTYLNDNQYILINDFLGNDFHTFLLFDDYYENNTNFSGEYKVFYNDKKDYEKFITDISSYLNVSKSDLTASTFSKTTSNFEMVKTIYTIVTIIILVSIFVTNLFSSFKKSNEIGIYKLNGISNFKIIKYLMSKNLRFLTLISAIIFIITNILIKNNNLYFVLLLFIAFLIILLLELLLCIISVIFMIKKVQLSNLIKKKNLTSGIIKFNSLFKIIVLGIIIVLVSIIMTQLIAFNNRKNDLKLFEKYSDYSVFARFYEGNDFNNIVGSSDSLDKAELELYKYLNDYDIVYADFKTYFIKSQEEANYYSIPTTQGNKKYKYGTIDYNYLDNLNLTNSITNQKIEIEKNYSSNVFLISNSLSNEVESFKSFYYEYYEPKENDLFIVYDDKDIPSLSPEIAKENGYLISSPIMRVITPSNVELRDVNVYGSGYDTALKIRTGNTDKKIEFYNKIHPKLVELKLDDNINSNVFYTYSELFDTELNSVRQQILTFTIILLLLIICYIYVIIQANLLYLKNEYKTISIKKLNGFSNSKIFRNHILNSFIVSVIVILIVVAFFSRYFNLMYILISGIVGLLIELIFSFIIIKITANKYIVIAIKGGEL